MNLPANFNYSQTNLQDFVDCRRRFQLKHLLHLAWPAIEAEPVLEYEHQIQIGSQFHHLIHQFSLGIPLSELVISKQADELSLWWENFKGAIADGGSLHEVWSPATQRLSEITLSGKLGNVRVVAKIDLIAIHTNGIFQIYDWKTSQHVPKRSWLAQRIQTKIYPYLLHQAGAFLNKGEQITPTQIEMIYWYSSRPDEPTCFPYSLKQYKEDVSYLQTLSNALLQLKENEFFMTDDENRCRFCVYRSLCNRGLSAGHLDDPEQYIMDEEDIYINFNQIDEIAY